MADISKIKIENATYDIKDDTARGEIETLQIPKNSFQNRKFILIGDSYGEGYTPDGWVTSWQEYFVTYSGISAANVTRKWQGGAGFVAIGNNKTFQTLLEEVSSSNEITDIIALGGYNDLPYNGNQIKTAINAFILKAKQLFPNANVHIGNIGCTTDSTKVYSVYQVTNNYQFACKVHGAHYLTGIEHSLHSYYNSFSSDGFHPNATGQQFIANNLVEAFVAGSTEVLLGYTNINITPASGVTLGSFSGMGCSLKGNVVEVSNQNTSMAVAFNPKLTISGRDNWIEIGTMTSGYIVGTNLNYSMIPVRIVTHSDEGYLDGTGFIRFQNNKMYINVGFRTNATNSNYQAYTNLDQIQIGCWHGIFLSDMC